MISTRERTRQKEWMDDLELKGAELRDTLDTLGKINSRLGGNRVLRSGLKRILKEWDHKRPLRILDVGCGNGAQLRELAQLGMDLECSFQLTGLDANADCIAYAKERSASQPEINYICDDAFGYAEVGPDYDLIVCTLFLHHISNEDLIDLLKSFRKKASLAVLVNDLHRSKLAYVLFSLLGLFIKNPMIVHDGKVSILRGFKKKELINFSRTLKCKYSIKWMWAFRYRWILFS